MIALVAIVFAQTFGSPFVSGFVTGYAFLHKLRTRRLDAAVEMVEIVGEVVEDLA
jgi:hypothetical protein